MNNYEALCVCLELDPSTLQSLNVLPDNAKELFSKITSLPIKTQELFFDMFKDVSEENVVKLHTAKQMLTIPAA